MANDRSEALLRDRCRNTVDRLDVPCGLVVTTRHADWIVYCSDQSAAPRFGGDGLLLNVPS